jgi:hypothetical protein
MKTIEDLKDELSLTYGKLISGMDAIELTDVMAFILTTFADDFPLLKAQAYQLANLDTTTGRYKLYITDFDEDFLELKMMIPIKPKMSKLYAYMANADMLTGFIDLEEGFAIQLANQYVNSMSSYYVPKKPMILNDSTGGFITIDKDVVIFGLCERIVNPSLIPEHIYSVLRSYASYKFVDFIINRNFGDVIEMNKKVFDLMYNTTESDMTSGGTDSIASVSLGGLSVSFNNKLESYSNALSGLSQASMNPTFIQEMNKIKDKHLKAFKRKKNMFYNFLF